MSGLERRYRRLLFFYPRGYRRARADEIVSTLMELAPAGRTRPTAREAANLLGHGLRARLGRPASRTVVVWAGLTAVLCGLFAGALGTRVGWAWARPLPPAAEARAVFAAVLPGHPIGEDNLQLDEGHFSVAGRAMTWQDTGLLLGFETDLHTASAVSAFVRGSSPIAHEQTLRTAQERLRAAGWSPHPVMTLDVNGCARCDATGHPERYKLFAVRGDTILELNLNTPQDGMDSYLSVHLKRATPWTVYPAGIVIGLLGLALGWMAFGWASRRTEARPFAQALAILSHGLGMLVWLAIAAFGLSEKVPWHLGTPRPRWEPMWEWLGLPELLLFFHFGSACALFALAIAAWPRFGVGEARKDAPA